MVLESLYYGTIADSQAELIQRVDCKLMTNNMAIVLNCSTKLFSYDKMILIECIFTDILS